MAVCKNCNSELPEGAMFCMKCGTKVETELFCPQCGTKVPAGAAFCMKCGAKIGGAAAAATATKQAAQGNKIVVSPDGSTGYSSIQAAVDAASDGMMIEIMPGTYKENIKIEKNIALVGIADDNGNFPTITNPDGGNPHIDMIRIKGNVNLYRLNLESKKVAAIDAVSDAFIYSELNFCSRIYIKPLDDFSEDCEISNCTIIGSAAVSSNSILLYSGKVNPPKNLVKVRYCNFEKGSLQPRFLDIENCTIGEVCSDPTGSYPFSVKNCKILKRNYSYFEEDEAKYVNCTILSEG